MRNSLIGTAVLGAMLVAPALAANTMGNPTPGTDRNSNLTAPATGRMDAEDRKEERADARETLNDATKLVQRMKSDPEVSHLLQQAQGVYLVPKFGKAALGIGGRGGEGVLLVQRNGEWKGPAFYNMGGISAGLQAGASGGAIAMLLMTDKAVNSFKQDNNFSLNADADLTVVSYSKAGQASVGKGDVVLWSDTKGLFAGVAVSVTDINYDEDETAAYYGRKVAAADVIDGTAAGKPATALIEALPAGEQRAVGGTAGSTAGGVSGGTDGATKR